MKNPSFSIIVPVYNAEAYLPRCIGSILSQTFTDFELLLINDGSTDNSGNICDAYAQRDDRVRVFHKKNGGVSSARNLGIDNAKGEWIAFCDADDYISNDFLVIEDKYIECDVIEKPFVIEIDGRIKKQPKRTERIYCGEKVLYKYYLKERNTALWNKLISMRLVQGKRFDETVSIGEDLLFFLSFINQIHRYAISNIGVYYYVRNDMSAMSIVNEDVHSRVQSALLLNDKIKKSISDSSLVHGLILQNNLFYFYKNIKLFNVQDYKAVNEIFNLINLENVRLLPFFVKSKVFILKILFLIKNMFLMGRSSYK